MIGITEIRMKRLFIIALLSYSSITPHSGIEVQKKPAVSAPVLYIKPEQVQQLRSELIGQLTKLQRGLQAWYYTPQAAFNLTAKTVYDCSDRDIAIFPFAQGLWYLTTDEFLKLICVNRISKKWDKIRTLIHDVHEVRYQLHLITCKDLGISNTLCGNVGYKEIEYKVKSNTNFAKKYKQCVIDGLIISYLYEIGIIK